jgi:hypothetical protein
MDNFFAMDIRRAGIQVMETVYIIGTSKNIETIKSRHDFLLTIIDTLKQGQNNPQYSVYIQAAIDYYKSSYYDRPPKDYQLTILSNPSDFDLNDFYCKALLNAMKRFCGEQENEINALKRENAKAKRKAKVIETIKSTQAELQAKCGRASFYDQSISELENLKTTFH